MPNDEVNHLPDLPKLFSNGDNLDKPKPKKNLDPVSTAMNAVVENRPWKPLLMIETDPCVGSLNERAESIYQAHVNMYNQWENSIIQEQVQKLTSMGEVNQIVKIGGSAIQRKKIYLGNFFRDLVFYCFEVSQIKANREVTRKGSRVDIVVADVLDVSVKNTMRDRENDRDHPVQVLYKAELSLKMLTKFQNENSIVIIVNDESRNKAVQRLAKKSINLSVYSLDEGIAKIKERLDGMGVSYKPYSLFA